MKNNQLISSWGGKRLGSGRKSGVATTTLIKRQLIEFISDDELQHLIKKALEMAYSGNKDMLKYVLDQCLGKAVQKVQLEEQLSFNNSHSELDRLAEELDELQRHKFSLNQ